MRRLLGVGAAALDDQTADAPGLDRGTRFRNRRIQFLRPTVRLFVEGAYGPRCLTTVFDASFADRCAVQIAGIEPRTQNQAFPPFWTALAFITTARTNASACPTMVRVCRDVSTHAVACRPLGTRECQIDVFMNLVRALVVEFGSEHPPQIHALELNGLSLLYGVPRQRDRVRPLLPCSDKWAVTDLSRLIRKRPSDNIVYTIRVRENGGENDRFAGSNLRYIRLQAEEYWCPFHGGGCQVFASRGGFTRVTGLSRPSHCVTARICARGHGPGHRGHARCRGLIIPTASRKEPREETEVKSCSHVASVPGDADACNPGSQY